jgi:hypothetical protein
MNRMDHSEVVRLQAAEKYLLGELSPELREEYEEHYFECEECASDLKAAAAFTDGARELFRKERSQRKGGVQFAGWLGWLRPAIAAPALAALLLIVFYQSFVAIPKLQRQAVASMASQSADFVSLIGANSRGEGAKVFQVHGDRPAILEVDIPASGAFAGYVCRIQDAAGSAIYHNRVSAADAKSTVHLVLPRGGLKPGQYSLAVLGEGASPSIAGSRNEIERLTFSVEVLP